MKGGVDATAQKEETREKISWPNSPVSFKTTHDFFLDKIWSILFRFSSASSKGNLQGFCLYFVNNLKICTSDPQKNSYFANRK